MLKIKDDVDLKELKKFGFKKQKSVINRRGALYQYVSPNGNTINVYEDDRILGMCYGYRLDYFDKLFDLIKAGLVEKVKE